MLRLRNDFLNLGVIVGALPFQIIDGTPIDAPPVMGNFNWIVSQINANVPPLIPSLGVTTIYVPAANVGGTANAITLAPSPINSGYAAGQRYSFPPSAQNTGATTVAVSGLTAQSIRMGDGTSLTGGELQSTGIVDIQYDGTNFVLLNSAQGTGIVPWTPVMQFGGGSTGVTYATQLGHYIKIGRMVYFWCQVSLSSKGSSTGAAAVSGLPYNVAALTEVYVTSVEVACLFVTYGAGSYVTGNLQAGTNKVGFYANTSASGVGFLADTNFANNSSLVFSGYYPV